MVLLLPRGQISLDLRSLPDSEAHPDVEDDEDSHGKDEEDERGELVQRIVLRKKEGRKGGSGVKCGE